MKADFTGTKPVVKFDSCENIVLYLLVMQECAESCMKIGYYCKGKSRSLYAHKL